MIHLWRYLMTWAGCGLTLLCLMGCGSSTGKVTVSGHVSFDGTPIQSGEIRLVPVADTQFRTVGRRIAEGRYQLDEQQAVPSGTYRVEVYGYRNRDGSPGLVDPQDAEADFVQFVPARYNQRSQLTLDVDAATGAIQHDLELTK